MGLAPEANIMPYGLGLENTTNLRYKEIRNPYMAF